MRNFADKDDIQNFFDVGKMGIEHALLPEQGYCRPRGLRDWRGFPYLYLWRAGGLSTGVGSTDMACGMITGKAWFKVPSAIRVELKGKWQPFVSGKM